MAIHMNSLIAAYQELEKKANAPVNDPGLVQHMVDLRVSGLTVEEIAASVGVSQTMVEAALGLMAAGGGETGSAVSIKV